MNELKYLCTWEEKKHSEGYENLSCVRRKGVTAATCVDCTFARVILKRGGREDE